MKNDDPKLTAYALGELDEAGRAEVEELMARDEEARRFVDEVKRTATMLSASLTAAELPKLGDAQKQAISAAAKGHKLSYEPIRRKDRRWWARAVTWAAAACVGVVAGVAWFVARPDPTAVAINRNLKAMQQAMLAYTNENKTRTYEPQFEKLVNPGKESPGGPASQTAVFSGVPSGGLDVVKFYANLGLPGVGQVQLQGVNLGDGTIATDPAPGTGKGVGHGLGFGEAQGPTKLGAGTLSIGGGTFGVNGKPVSNWTWAGDSVTIPTKEEDGWAESAARLAVKGPGAVGGSYDFTESKAVVARKTELGREFDAKLTKARELAALGDKDTAARQLADARRMVDGEMLLLTPVETAQYNARIGQIEATVGNTESYALIHDNPFKKVMNEPLSTFSIDVDTASYSNVRRFIGQGQLPPPDAVRIEEMVNYFPYNYELPEADSAHPLAATVEVAGCPWNSKHRLARVAIKGKEITHDKRPVSNLVFLIDVSGSMNEPKKLPLVKDGLKLLVNELTENDRVAMVVYAGAAGLVLPSTHADPKNKETILQAIETLSAGGSTNGGQGVQLAYKLATDHFIKGGTNRVILCTDGDWNVGITDQGSLVHLIEQQAKSGVFLSIMGFGYGNLKDSTMEKLADKGNGHYGYIDDIKEARKVFVEEMSGMLCTIAKDVKIQIEFNPAKVASYRLIGYDNRMLRKEDFNNDKIDAGEIGAGHCVTALYELAPATAPAKPATRPVDDLKYQKHQIVQSDEMLTLKIRYKKPDGDKSTLVEFPAIDRGLPYSKASEDFKFASAVAQFGMILRNSPHKGTASFDGVIELADEGKGKDAKGYRGEFVELVKKAKGVRR